MKSRVLISIGNAVMFMAVITVNALANALPINGMNTGQVSALYPSLFTPAGITFSIWSVIYLALLGFVVFQFSLRDRPYFVTLSTWFIISCVLNIGWILVWHHLLPAASVIVMLLFLVVLIRIFTLVQYVPIDSTKEYLLLRLPFTLYLSWICVATIANIAAWLSSLQWIDSLSAQTTLTIVMMLVATALAIVVVRRFRDYAFPAVTLWALVGIALNGLKTITPAAIAMAIALLALVVFDVVRFRRRSIS